VRSIALILLAAAPMCAQGVVKNAVGQVVPRPPVQPTSFDCAADGTVVNSATGEPVVRARVSITAGDYAYSAVTDGSGGWALANLACTSAQMQITRIGFLQGGAARQTDASPFRVLRLTSGSPVHAIRTELTPQSVAYGKVVDDQGDPVLGVTVSAMSARVFDGRIRFQPGGSTQTNDLGEYRIANLARGKFVFCARSRPFGGPQPQGQSAQTMPADSCYPGPIDGGSASAMDLPAGREAKVDFTLGQVTAVHVRGAVTGLPEGRGTGIRMIRRGNEIGNDVPGNVRDGKFDFLVPPGAYTIAADYFENGTRLMARVPVDVGGAEIDNLVVHLEPGFTVTGIVHTTSQSGRAAPQQFGMLLRSSDQTAGGGQVKWDADHASFSITEMTAGSYRLEIGPPPPFYVKSATLAGQDILNNEIQISQAAGPIDVQLRDDGGTLEGDATDGNGQPVLSSVMLLRGNLRVANPMAQTGHFKLQNVAPGDYTICAWDDQTNIQYADPDWMRRNATGCQTVSVTAGQSQQIKLAQQIAPE
jgi:hypothetical protein